jgi:hypothetical protein
LHVVQLTPKRQVEPLQHPAAQEVVSQMQAPDTQRCPATHEGPVPQWQVPPEQVSLSVGSHAVHAPAPVPQVASEGALHVEPEQQPLVHVIEQPVQAPAEQVPVPHEAHAAPPDPHAVSELPARQVVPEQQPVGQLVPLHTHAPPTQA